MTATAEFFAQIRTTLYVPGHRPDRFAKARDSGADTIVLDLEDSVGPALKVTARDNVRRWLCAGEGGAIRVNGPGSDWYADDVAMLAARPSVVVLPKVCSASQVEALVARLAAGSCVIPILETAAGILAAPEICAVRGVARVIFGSGDLARELGVDHTNLRSLETARAQVVLASAACGLVAPLDGASTALTDMDTVRVEAQSAAALGFGGKSCIHPRQIPVVRAAFEPSAAELHWARSVVMACTPTGSISSHHGQVIGRPIVERARRLLRQHDAS